jgi:hypothetical protein
MSTWQWECGTARAEVQRIDGVLVCVVYGVILGPCIASLADWVAMEVATHDALVLLLDLRAALLCLGDDYYCSPAHAMAHVPVGIICSPELRSQFERRARASADAGVTRLVFTEIGPAVSWAQVRAQVRAAARVHSGFGLLADPIRDEPESACAHAWAEPRPRPQPRMPLR